MNNHICIAHWTFDQSPDAEPADRNDPYYFQLCYADYAALQVDRTGSPIPPTWANNGQPPR